MDPYQVPEGVIEGERPLEERIDEAPLVSAELVEYLDGIFPDACIGKDETLEQAHRRAGARDLVRHLQKVHNHQISGGAA